MKLSWKNGIALVLGGLMLGGVMSARAQNDEGSTTPDDMDTVQFEAAGPDGAGFVMHGGPGGAGRFGGRLLRSESVVEDEDGKFITINADSGELTAIDGTKLTIKEADGRSVEVTTNDDTKFGRDGERAKLSDLKVGDHVFAHRADGVTKHVMAISPERYKEMEAKRAEFEKQRAACKDNDQATECNREDFGSHGFRGRKGGPGGPKMGERRFSDRGDVERAPEPASLGDEAAV